MATLQALAASDRLQELRIWDDGEGMGMASDHPARLGNEHLAIIAGIDSLEHLTIGGWDMAYDDQGLAVLSRLGRLKSLNLSQSQGITDRGMAYLADFPALEALDISYTNISDVGLEALLAAPHLKHLDYGWAAAADASLARFEAAYPEAPFLQP